MYTLQNSFAKSVFKAFRHCTCQSFFAITHFARKKIAAYKSPNKTSFIAKRAIFLLSFKQSNQNDTKVDDLSLSFKL